MKATKYTLAIALGSVALLVPNAAWGDSVNYTINATFGGGTTTLTGTLTIDSTTGQTISGTVTTTGAVPLGPLPLHISDQPFGGGGSWNDLFNNGGLPTVDFAYNWPGSALSSIPLISPIAGQDGPGFCAGNACGIFTPAGAKVDIQVFDGGSLTLVPEPSSLLLLGTGLIGLGALRRRFHRTN